jgi:hypothetical protein
LPYVKRLGLSAIILSSGAAAQQAPAGTTFQIIPRFDVLYDTNMARSSDEAAERRGLSKSDVRYTPGISISGQSPLGGQIWFLNSAVGYDIHQRNRSLDRERITASGGVKIGISQCSATITGGFSRSQTEVSDFIDLERVKNTQTGTSLALDGRCGSSVGLTPTFGVSRSWAKNSDDFRRFGDSTSTSVTAGLAYARPALGEVAISAQRTVVAYPNHEDLLANIDRGYKLYSFGGRFSRRIGSRIGGTLGVYHTTVEKDQEGGGFQGITADGAVDLTLSDSTRVFLVLQRQVLPANLFAGDYVLAKRYSVRAERRIGPRLVLGLGGEVNDREIRGRLPFPIVALESERRYVGFATAKYDLRRNTMLSVDLRREVRDAEPALFKYSSTRALLSVSHAFGRF